MNDLSKTIEAKSDQLNADDLIGGEKIILVTSVKVISGDQPVAIHYEGDNNKPYKPCKSMRRLLVMAWGKNGDDYIGRMMTLFNDKSVKWAGQDVGGIRISHLSHIKNDIVLPLTFTRGKRAPYRVRVMDYQAKTEQPKQPIHSEPSIDKAKALKDFFAEGSSEGWWEFITEDEQKNIKSNFSLSALNSLKEEAKIRMSKSSKDGSK